MSRDVPLEELASLPSFYHPVAAPDGDRVALYYDGSGRNELCLLDPDAGELTRVSDGEVPRDATYPPRWSADGERVFFHRDEGGDEQNDVHALALDGAHEVVVEDDGQCVLQDVDPAGRFLLYASTRGGQMNLYRHDVDSGESTRLTEHERPVFAAELSPDGERVAYVTNESDDLENRDAYVMDADGGESRRLGISPDGYQSAVADWFPDGESLLVGDDAAACDRVGVYDLEADEVRWLSDGSRVERPELALPGGRALATRVREGSVVPVAYDGGEGRELPVPDGEWRVDGHGRSSSLLADGSVLLTHRSPTERDGLLAYDLDADESRTLLPPDYGDIDPAAFVDAEYVTYESTDGLEIGALLYDSGERPSPVVVLVHGGPHWHAAKRFNPHVQFLVARGYSVLLPNYRGSIGRGREFENAVHGDWGGMEQEDVAAGARWIAGKEWVDEDRLAVYGGSYGGYSAYWQLVRYPGLWDAGVAWIGITDLPALMEESMPHFRSILREQMGDPDENADLWRERSPVTHVEDIEAPLLIAHGVNDPRCPVSQARRFRDALEERRGWTAGEEFEYVELGAEGHGSTDIDQKIRVFRLLADFLDERIPAADSA